MPRPLSYNLDAALGRISQPGYLLRWNGSSVLRWSSVGDVTYDGVPWVKYDFRIEGLSFDPEAAKRVSLKVQNFDSLAAGFFVNAAMADVTVDIWQVAPTALSVGDPAYLCQLAVDSCEIGADFMTVSLVESVSQYAFSPRRRIDPANGFNYALPAGRQIPWEGEIYIVEEEDG